MHKVNYSLSRAQIFYPENTIEEVLSVTEIGYGEPPAGFDSKITQTDTAVLYYVLSGSGYFNGKPFKAPALLIARPDFHSNYTVGCDCNCFSVYWIKFCGDKIPHILAESGLGTDNDIFSIINVEVIRDAFSSFINEDNYSSNIDSIYMLSGLYRLLSLTPLAIDLTHQETLSQYTRAVLDYIHTNYQSEINEKSLAAIVNLSTNYMHKIFLSDMGTTPINYLNLYRINQAKRILINTNFSIANVADAVGISGGDYFCRVFRKYSGGTSPSAYRKQNRK